MSESTQTEVNALARLVERDTAEGGQVLDQLRVAPGLEEALGAALADDLRDAYDAAAGVDPRALDPVAFGQRALKNAALGYLARLPDGAGWGLCEQQYRAQANMTDVIAALRLLADSAAPARESLLEDFAERWRDDALVMDKWFSVQAMSTRADTLAQVTALLGHPAFSLRNPNKVRALIGTFCAANPVRFHAADGSGYDFLVDHVLQIDRDTPQIAARLLRNLA